MTFVQSTNVNKTEAKTSFGPNNGPFYNTKEKNSVFTNNNPEGNVDSYNASNPVNPVKSKTISAEELNNNLDEIIESLIAEAKANGEENLYEYVYDKLNEYVNNNIKDETQRLSLLNKYLQSQRIAELQQGSVTQGISLEGQDTSEVNCLLIQYLSSKYEKSEFLRCVFPEGINNPTPEQLAAMSDGEQIARALLNKEITVKQASAQLGLDKKFDSEQIKIFYEKLRKGEALSEKENELLQCVYLPNLACMTTLYKYGCEKINNGGETYQNLVANIKNVNLFMQDILGPEFAQNIETEATQITAEALQNEDLNENQIAFLNEVTNGNFSIALYNIQHGTDIPFNSMQSEDEGTAQSEAGASASVTSEAGTAQNNKPIENNSIENKTVDLGFNQKTETQPELPKIELPLEEIQAAPSASATCIKKAPTTIAEVLSPEGNIIQKIIEFTNRVGIVSAAQKLIESDDSYCRDFALNNIFERFNNGQQVNLYNRLTDCSSRIETIRRITDLDVLKKLRAVDSITTKFKEERTEVLAERNPGSINSIA